MGKPSELELTQSRHMFVDLVAVAQLQNCHAAEEGHQAALASVRSGWDSLLLMTMKGGRYMRRRALLPFAHAAMRDGVAE